LTTIEVAYFQRRAFMTTQRSKVRSDMSAVKDLVLDVVEAVAIEEVVGGLLQTLAELTSAPSLEL
jgi:hypothetical protein